MTAEATATMPLSVAADLVAGHVDTLWNQVVNDEDMHGCCPRCCAPCHALRELLKLGQLDFLYGQYMQVSGGESSVWDTGKQQIDRSWFAGAWRNDLGCHEEQADA